jgi:NAD+ kinase
VSACDLIAALGGDGTILKALHAAAGTATPVMGVSYGSLGALASVPQSELLLGLDRYATGSWFAETLPALVVDGADGERIWALNDLVLARRGTTQLSVDVFIGQDTYVRVAGDGIVIATPLGSSAYSMAAGGPLLAPGARAFVCTPLAMHGGCAPPLVVADDRSVTLQLHPGHGGFNVEIDGARFATATERFAVTTEQRYATLVALDESCAGVRRLRERGLIADSPRVLARRHRAPDSLPPRLASGEASHVSSAPTGGTAPGGSAAASGRGEAGS